jgi:hypothetical protein
MNNTPQTEIAGTDFSARRSVENWLHCRQCFDELPPNTSPKEWARLSVGWTVQGLQVWCDRHECNVLHVDFEGARHPAITYAREPSVTQ